MDPNGPKLLESRKGQISNRLICGQIDGGRDRVRTCDPLLAKQVLSQLSYTPTVKTCIDVKAFATVRKLRKFSVLKNNA